MIQEKIRKVILAALKKAYPSVKIVEGDIEVARSKQGFGDFTSNILLKKKSEWPGDFSDVIRKVVAGIMKEKGSEFIEIVDGIGGRLNFTLNEKYYSDGLAEILEKKKNFGSLDLFKGKKIQVEFISANPTGPLTLANGRGGFSGDVLANVLSKAGANVEREYYVNDGGNQVIMLANSVLAEAGQISEPDERYRGEYITEFAHEHAKECKALENNLMELGQMAAKIVLENLIKPAVAKMGISFENWFSEKGMIERGEVEEAIEKLKKYGHTKEGDGALWMKTTDFGDEKDRVLVKSDGEKTYFANDVAYHFDKLYKRKFDKVIDLWGADHHGYVARMKAAVEAMGCPGFLDVIIFQMVRLIKDGQEYKMSKRKGTYITIDDLLELISQGDPSTNAQDLREASDVARFFFLSKDFNTHMDFDLDLAKDNSEKNPVFYVKYAFARISGILRNAKSLGVISTGVEKSKKISRQARDDMDIADLSLLKEEKEQELIKELLRLPEVVEDIAANPDYPVHVLTFYIREIATKFHAFYDKCRVIDESNAELTAARLKLVEATKIVLRIVGEDLIGIEMPEKM